jgi:hypothetical protein
MVTACPGSAFRQEGHSHVLNGWNDPTFDATQSLGHRSLQGRTRQGVMNTLNSVDCPVKGFILVPSSLWTPPLQTWAPSLCGVGRVCTGHSGLVY